MTTVFTLSALATVRLFLSKMVGICFRLYWCRLCVLLWWLMCIICLIFLAARCLYVPCSEGSRCQIAFSVSTINVLTNNWEYCSTAKLNPSLKALVCLIDFYWYFTWIYIATFVSFRSLTYILCFKLRIFCHSISLCYRIIHFTCLSPWT
jgi:hypothetical protein